MTEINICKEDEEKFAEYLEYLKCEKCKNFVVDEFKYCPKCNNTTCRKCACQIDGHESKHPRHVISLLEKLHFKCGKCNKADFKYFELIQHREKCEGEGMCQECGQALIKEDIKSHFENCVKESKNVDCTEQIDNFVKYANDMNNKVTEYINEENVLFSENFLSQIHKLLYTPIQENKEGINTQSFIDSSAQIDAQIAALTEEKNKIYESISSQIQKIQSVAKFPIQQQNDEIDSITAENVLMLDYIKSSITFLPNRCSICGEGSTRKFFFCHKCACIFCQEKCALKCGSESCRNFVCPSDAIGCDLCESSEYCENCMIKCFSEKCQNIFCPKCFSKYKHQMRDRGESCNLVKCELCNDDMCIMSSILCNHCDKRICKKCFRKDEIHRAWFKIKKKIFGNKLL